MKFCLFLLFLVGFVTGRLPSDNVLEEIVKNQNVPYGQFSEDFNEVMDKISKQYINDDLEPPQFYSPSYGKDIVGKNMESYYGRPLYGFQGIQYGNPPTEEYNGRFRPSNMSTLYDGTPGPIVADQIGSMCPQPRLIIGSNSKGSEDCLYLNVYTPYLPGSNENEPLPVMLFIHGGSFTFGDSSPYLPQKLLDHDVILVTIHYRLGAFGFFSLDNADAPGNSALYDMVLSIKWVNKFIADFGGDPEKVTIFGESAGAVSSNYMLLISEVKDMIHGVISESGSVLDPWAIDSDPRYAAEYVAKYVNCTIENDELMYECVAKASQNDLVDAQMQLVSEDQYNGLIGFRGCAPSVQKYSGNSWNVLLKKTPREYYESGEVNPLPLFQGTNKQEGSLVLAIMYYAFLVPHNYLDNEMYMRNQFITDTLATVGIEDTTHSLTDSLIEYYCLHLDLGSFEDSSPCMVDIFGVLYLKGSGWETANLHSYYTNDKTFHYSFDFESDDSMWFWMLGPQIPGLDPGVTHADELMYLFTMPATMEGQQITTMDRMTLLWTNFAKYGDPTPDENAEPWQDLSIPKWPQFLPDDHHFMLMKDDFTVDLAEFPDRWTISVDELDNSPENTTSTTTTHTDDGSTTTEDPSDNCNSPTQEEYDDLKSTSDAYLATMIVFIVLFVVADGVVLYIFMKNR